MQNTANELTQRLLNALDTDYNVVDLSTVFEVISTLEDLSISKELLQATRLGKLVNEVRRNTDNDVLSRRTKDLVKKWRNLILPTLVATGGGGGGDGDSPPPPLPSSQPPKRRNVTSSAEDGCSSGAPTVKRPKLNGQHNNNNTNTNNNNNIDDDSELIVINNCVNSDNNTLLVGAEHVPKKRGRKKGSRNHKNLVDAAETAFTNKLAAVCRSGGATSKVKTTQELLASLQNRNLNNNNNNSNTNNNNNNSNSAKREDLTTRAAILTERVSIIDQKLNTKLNRYRRHSLQTRPLYSDGKKKRKPSKTNNNRNHIANVTCPTTVSGSVINDVVVVKIDDHTESSDLDEDDDEDDDVIIVDDDDDDEDSTTLLDELSVDVTAVRKSLTVEEALAQLPPIVDRGAILTESDPEPSCTCDLIVLTDDAIDSSCNVINEKNTETSPPPPFDTYVFRADPKCQASVTLTERYHYNVSDVEELRRRVQQLHTHNLANLNGNYSSSCPIDDVDDDVDSCQLSTTVNVVPNVHMVKELPKVGFACETYKKYSISEVEPERADKVGTFSEWHQTVEMPSYNAELLKILPYVIID